MGIMPRTLKGTIWLTTLIIVLAWLVGGPIGVLFVAGTAIAWVIVFYALVFTHMLRSAPPAQRR